MSKDLLKIMNITRDKANYMSTEELKYRRERASLKADIYRSELHRRDADNYYLVSKDGGVVHIGNEAAINDLAKDKDILKQFEEGFLFSQERMDDLFEDYILQKEGIA